MSYGRHSRFRPQRRFRHQRRFNPAKALIALLTLAVVAGLAYGGFHLLFGENGLFTGQGKSPLASVGTQGGTGTADPTADVPAQSQEITPTPTPTPRPTPEAMPPESTDPAVLKVSWEAPSVFDGANAFPEAAKELAGGAGGEPGTLYSWTLQNGKPAENPGSEVSFGPSETYASIDGVLTFRGNQYRNGASAGTRAISEKKLEIVWERATGAVTSTGSYWPGTGWTGQPLLVHWNGETRLAMNLNEDAKAKDLTEVIYPTLDGNIYFLDLETGEPTREKIAIGFPFKGTAVVDPRGYPLLYAGQGLNENSGKYGEFQYRIFNLLNQEQIYALPGRDAMAFRPWGAFDSSGQIGRAHV